MDTLVKPLPHITPTNRPYFEGAKQGSLRIQHCRSCDRHIFFPREACPHCLAVSELEWVTASGRGTVYSYSIVHRPQHPAFYSEVPILFVAIKLAEGPVMLSEMRGIAPEQVKIGMPVQVGFLDITAEVTIPIWEPAGPGHESGTELA